MKHHYDIVTVGGAVNDITFYTSTGRVFRTPENPLEQRMLAFEFGAKISVSEIHTSLGGGAANSANIFRKLGMKTAALTRVGEDVWGKSLLKTLRQNKIFTNLVQKDTMLGTGLSFIICSKKIEHEHIIFAYRGAGDNLDITPEILKQIDTRWFYVTSLSGTDWTRDLKNLFLYAKENHAKIAWNPGNIQLAAGKKSLEDFLRNTSILILNKDEAIELVLSGIKVGKRNPRFLNKTLYLLNILNEWGPGIVVITEGVKGASALREGKFYHVGSVKKKAVNTIGVGDAFGATFVHGIMTRRSIETSLKRAAYNAASVLTRPGAQDGAVTLQELVKKYGNS